MPTILLTGFPIECLSCQPKFD